MIVLDASAGVAIAAKRLSGRALRPALLATDEVQAPRLFQVEVANAVWKYVMAGDMSQDQALAIHAAATALVDTFINDAELVEPALREAIGLSHPIYDMLYLVLTHRTGAQLCTLDRRLAKIAGQLDLAVVELEAQGQPDRPRSAPS